MAGKTQAEGQEPRGFGEHTRKTSGENAHEQGWGLKQEERTRIPEEKQAWEGGRDYDFGARDFGDTAVDTSGAQPAPAAEKMRAQAAGGEAGTSGKKKRRAG